MPKTYRLYGVRLGSGWPLLGVPEEGSSTPDVELLRAGALRLTNTFPEEKRSDWFLCRRLSDGSLYLRWTELFEFIVSADGKKIDARPLANASQETFQAYLLSQVLSFALVQQGIEPLHATAVASPSGAIAFIADSGQGKSTLAAAFLRSEYSLLTDDVLVTRASSRGVMVQPGLPRIKLYPRPAHVVLGRNGEGTRMNPHTTKRIFPLTRKKFRNVPVPLRAIYVLRRTRTRRVAIKSLSPRAAFLALIANTFNPVVADPARLARQFRFAEQLVARIPIRSLTYPRRLSLLPRVVEAIEKDLLRLS